MRFVFWRRAEPVEVETGECKHDWSNWTDPEPSSVKVYSAGWSSSEERDALMQSHRCLKCNQHERRYC